MRSRRAHRTGRRFDRIRPLRLSPARSVHKSQRRPITVLTRPESADDNALRLALQARGRHILVQPLLRTVLLASSPQDWSGVQALLATSPRAFSRISPPPPLLPVFVVGQAAARAAKAAGCQNIQIARDARNLAAIVRNSCPPTSGMLLYRAGRDRSRDLARMLPDHDVQLVQVYAAEPNHHLAPAVRRAFAANQVSHVTLHSARAARAFVTACRAAGVLPQARRVQALCLSRRIAALLQANGWRCAWGAPLPQADRLTGRLIGSRVIPRWQSAEPATTSVKADTLKPT
jgi:uroporphyrinogen-III synthase